MTAPSTAVSMCNIALSYVGWTEAIASLTADSNKADRQCNLHYSATLQEMLELFAWNSTIEHRPLILTSGFKAYNDKFGVTAPTISGITKANPGVITAGTHGFSTGHLVEVYDVGGMTEINTTNYGTVLRVTATDTNTLTTEINTTNFTAYTSGGSVRRCLPKGNYDYVYDIPTGFITGISLAEPEEPYEIISQAGSNELNTNAENAVLTYVRAMSDDATVSQFTQLFLDTFATALAIKLAVPLMGGVGGLKMKESLKESFEVLLNRAQTAEFKSENTVYEFESSFVTSRN